MFTSLIGKVYSAIEKIAMLLVIILTIVVSAQIISRFLNISYKWTVELSRFLFAWLGFMGMIIALKRGRISKFTGLVDKLTGKKKTIFTLFVNILVTVFLIALFFSSFEVVQMTHSQKMSTLPLQWSYVYLSFPFSLFFIIILFLTKIIEQIKKLYQEKEK